MYDIFIAMIVLIVASKYIAERSEGWMFSTSLVTMVFGVVYLAIYVVSVVGYEAAKHNADIINKKYGTTYTQADLFFAEKVILKIHHLEGVRIRTYDKTCVQKVEDEDTSKNK